jgi:hypothetical protein
MSGPAVAQAFAAAAAVFLAIGLLVAVEQAAPHKIGTYVLSVGSSASIALAADDQGQALFRNSVLGPGHSSVNCLRVKYAGEAGSGHLTLQASALSGPLVPYLQVRVERGTGGQYGNCNGFSGHAVFSGSIDDLTVAPGESWNVANGDVSTYRVTVSVLDDPAAQGVAAAGEFDVSLSGFAPTPPPTPSPVVTPTPLITPTPSQTQTPDASPTPSATPSAQRSGGPAGLTPPGATSTVVPAETATPSAEPTDAHPTPSHSPGSAGSPTPGSGAGGPGVGGSSGTGASGASAGGLSGLLHHLLPKIREVVSVLTRQPARRAEIPLTGLIFIVLFLLVQDQIDRREPKLALAPLHPATLQFSPIRGGSIDVSLASPDPEPDHDGPSRPDSERGGDSR